MPRILSEGVDLADLDGSRHLQTVKIACTRTGVSEMRKPKLPVLRGLRVSTGRVIMGLNA